MNEHSLSSKLKEANIPFETRYIFREFHGTRFLFNNRRDVVKAHKFIGGPIFYGREGKKYTFDIF